MGLVFLIVIAVMVAVFVDGGLTRWDCSLGVQRACDKIEATYVTKTGKDTHP